MDMLSRFFAVPGALVLRWIGALGDVFLFLLEGLRQIFIAPKLFFKVAQQVYVIGAKSLFVIVLIALFTGMVLGLQGYYVLVKFGSVGFLGAAVSLTLIRELGPVLTAIMVAVNMLFCFTAAKLLHFDLEDAIIASNANIGGPTTAAGMAVSQGWSRLVGPAMLVGVLGYVIGNYAGTVVGIILGA